MNINLAKYFLTASLISMAVTSSSLASADKDLQPQEAAKPQTLAVEALQNVIPIIPEEELEKLLANDPKLIAAAEAGNLDAISHLGACYANGLGCQRNTKVAMKWLLIGANKNHPESMCNLAACIENNVLESGSINGKWKAAEKQKAIEWYRKAARAGHVLSMNSLGNSLLELNLHVLQTKGRKHVSGTDTTEALNWFKAAADLGDAESMLSYGHCLQDSIGCRYSLENQKQAIEWFRKAIAKGLIKAYFSLAETLLLDRWCEDLPGRLEEAKLLYEQGAEKGHEGCMDALGTSYYEGSLGIKDTKLGEQWLKKAIAAGNEMSNCHLGAYAFLEKDYDKALIFLKNGLSAWSTHHLIGFIYLRKKEFEKALMHYELAQGAGEKVKQGILLSLRKKVIKSKAIPKAQRVNVIKEAAKQSLEAKLKSDKANNLKRYNKLVEKLENIFKDPDLSESFDFNVESELGNLKKIFAMATNGLDELEASKQRERVKKLKDFLGNIEEKILVEEQRIEIENRIRAHRQAARERKRDHDDVETTKQASSQMKKEAREAAAKAQKDEKNRKHSHLTRKHDKPTTQKAKDAKRKPSPETVKVEVVKGPFANMLKPVNKPKAQLNDTCWNNVYKIRDTLRTATSLDNARGLLEALDGDFDFKEVTPDYAGIPNADLVFQMRINQQYRVLIAFERVTEQVYEQDANGGNNNNPVEKVTYKLYGDTIYIDDPHKG